MGLRVIKLKYILKLIVNRYILRKDTMEIRVQYFRDRGVKIGENMRAFSKLLSAEPYLLEFGDNITVSTDVRFTTHDNSATKVIVNSTDLIGKIKIGNNCFIGQGTIILPGVELADSTIVAAGSVVTKSFADSGKIIGGNPAKVIGTIENYYNKYHEFTFDTRGLSYDEKKEMILLNESKLVKK